MTTSSLHCVTIVVLIVNCKCNHCGSLTALWFSLWFFDSILVTYLNKKHMIFDSMVKTKNSHHKLENKKNKPVRNLQFRSEGMEERERLMNFFSCLRRLKNRRNTEKTDLPLLEGQLIETNDRN